MRDPAREQRGPRVRESDIARFVVVAIRRIERLDAEPGAGEAAGIEAFHAENPKQDSEDWKRKAPLAPCHRVRGDRLRGYQFTDMRDVAGIERAD